MEGVGKILASLLPESRKRLNSTTPKFLDKLGLLFDVASEH